MNKEIQHELALLYVKLHADPSMSSKELLDLYVKTYFEIKDGCKDYPELHAGTKILE